MRPLSARPRLLPHDGVVAEHFGDRRLLWQTPEFLGRARLELAAVLHNRWADRDDPRFRTARRAAAQQARRDHEDGEPPRGASGDGHH